MPAKKSTQRKATAKKPAAKKTPVKKAAAKKTPVSKPRKPPARKPTAGRATAKSPVRSARRGDLIVVDSAKVGSAAREGEILEVIQGEVSLSYRVRWEDGRQTLITPTLGTARIVPASGRA